MCTNRLTRGHQPSRRERREERERESGGKKGRKRRRRSSEREGRRIGGSDIGLLYTQKEASLTAKAAARERFSVTGFFCFFLKFGRKLHLVSDLKFGLIMG